MTVYTVPHLNTTVSIETCVNIASPQLIDDLRLRGVPLRDTRRVDVDAVRSSRFYQQGYLMRGLRHAVVPMLRGAPAPHPLVSWQGYSRHAKGMYRTQTDADFQLLCMLFPDADARVVSDSHIDPEEWLRDFDVDFAGPALGEWVVEKFFWDVDSLSNYPSVLRTFRGYHILCRVSFGHTGESKAANLTGELGPAEAYSKDHKTKLDFRGDASILPLPGNLHKSGEVEYTSEGYTLENLSELPRMVRDPIKNQYAPKAAGEYHSLMKATRTGSIDLSQARWGFLSCLTLFTGGFHKVGCPLHARCVERADRCASVGMDIEGYTHFHCFRTSEHYSTAPWVDEDRLVKVTATQRDSFDEAFYSEADRTENRIVGGLIAQPLIAELDEENDEEDDRAEPIFQDPDGMWLRELEFDEGFDSERGTTGDPLQESRRTTLCPTPITSLYSSGAVRVDCQKWGCLGCGPRRLACLADSGIEWLSTEAHDFAGYHIVPEDNLLRKALKERLRRWGGDVLYVSPTSEAEYAICLWDGESAADAPSGVTLGDSIEIWTGLMGQVDLLEWSLSEGRTRLIGGKRSVTTAIHKRSKEMFTGLTVDQAETQTRTPPIACTLTDLSNVVNSVRARIEDLTFHAKQVSGEGRKQKYAWKSKIFDTRYPEDEQVIGSTIYDCVDNGDFTVTHFKPVSSVLDTEVVDLVIDDLRPSNVFQCDDDDEFDLMISDLTYSL